MMKGEFSSNQKPENKENKSSSASSSSSLMTKIQSFLPDFTKNPRKDVLAMNCMKTGLIALISGVGWELLKNEGVNREAYVAFPYKIVHLHMFKTLCKYLSYIYTDFNNALKSDKQEDDLHWCILLIEKSLKYHGELMEKPGRMTSYTIISSLLSDAWARLSAIEYRVLDANKKVLFKSYQEYVYKEFKEILNNSLIAASNE